MQTVTQMRMIRNCDNHAVAVKSKTLCLRGRRAPALSYVNWCAVRSRCTWPGVAARGFLDLPAAEKTIAEPVPLSPVTAGAAREAMNVASS